MRLPPLEQETPDRLIEAAGAVFGERGFRATTIRQITARAGVNLAAVHYHFQDKEGLYAQVLRRACTASRINLNALEGTAAQKLEAFVERFVGYLLDPARPAWHGRVMAMEMSNPTPALDRMAREVIDPLCGGLRRIIAKLGMFTPTEVDLIVASLFGQCLFYVHSRPMVERLFPHFADHPRRVRQIAGHIASFSLAAMAELRRATQANPKRLPTRL